MGTPLTRLNPRSQPPLRRPLKGDQFKSIVVLNLELPSIAQDFEDRLRNQLHNYNLIGKQSATLDDEFSFRSTAGKSQMGL